MELSEQEVIRRESLQKMRDMGINPVSYTHLTLPTNVNV